MKAAICYPQRVGDSHALQVLHRCSLDVSADTTLAPLSRLRAIRIIRQAYTHLLCHADPTCKSLLAIHRTVPVKGVYS